MLIPKKVSKQKIIGAALIIVTIVVYCAYILYKTFVAPYRNAPDSQNPVSEPVFETADNIDLPVPSADAPKTAKNPIGIFVDEKFKDLRDNMIISEAQIENVGKKNPFEKFPKEAPPSSGEREATTTPGSGGDFPVTETASSGPEYSDLSPEQINSGYEE